MTDQHYQKCADGKNITLEAREATGERLYSPSAARNRDVIRDIFLKVMPYQGHILEVGSGTGEHGIHIAAAAPELIWHGGDPDTPSRHSQAAWITHTGLTNMQSPHALDVCADDWGELEKIGFSGVMSANMIHIAPFTAATGLFAGAGRVLNTDGKLFLYGPFSRNGEHTSPSNANFDISLKSRDPEWGVRDLEQDLIPLAQKAGLVLDQVIAMPANNLAVTFNRQ